MKNALIFAIVMALAAFAGYTLQSHLVGSDTGSTSELGIRPEFAMLDLEGKQHNISDWDGQVILLNFWATWCPPCLEEIPAFIELQESYADQGLQILGVAVDDDQAVRAFADGMDFNYPVLPGGTDAIALSKRYGNKLGVLPYTVFINRDRVISHVIQGELSKKKAENILKQLGINI